MEKKYLTIVFDDGPREPMCEMIDKFKKYGFRAGFAIYGNNISDGTEHMLRYAADNGFTLVTHSQTHPHLENLTKQEIFDELTAPMNEIKKRIGYTVKMARFPYNSYNDTVLEVSKSLNLVLLGHGMYCGADSRPESSAETIAAETLKSACDGAIACMHVMPNTCKALDTILPELKNRGFEIVTPERLFEVKGIDKIPLDVYINNINDII